jgi:hypothetical protein
LTQKRVEKESCKCPGKRLGKIVGVPTHVEYIVRIDVEEVNNEEYSLGNYVAISPACGKVIVGVISDTILMDAEYSRYGLQLSNRDEISVFAPDYLDEKSTMVKILGLGFFELRKGIVGRYNDKKEKNEDEDFFGELMDMQPSHEICPVCPEIGSNVYLLEENEIRRFHLFFEGDDNNKKEKMKMGYLGLLMSRKDILTQSLVKLLLKRLIVLFPEERKALEMLCKNIEHKMKIEGAHAR